MIVSFAFPSSSHRTGGVIALYEFANAMSRRGHETHFIHGPAWPVRINSLDELPPFDFDENLYHHIVDELDDPSLPASDIAFFPRPPARLGQPVVFIQGYQMMPAEVEESVFRQPCPKLCIASWLTDVGESLGVPREQLWHVPMGIDHEIFAVRTPLDQRPYDVAMLYHDHREKGWDVGLATLREVCRRRPGLRGVVFGLITPPEELPSGIDFVFGLDHQGLADQVYNRARVFVQPSYHEGFGFTAVEAMACGAALVSTDNGGSDDYALPDTALVVPPGDVDGLVRSVETLLDDDDRRLRLASAGERHVRTFDWDHAAAVLEGHLEEYLEDPARFQEPSSAGAPPTTWGSTLRG
jgi:glycosyltransferase involved in cell wall biosynthesis